MVYPSRLEGILFPDKIIKTISSSETRLASFARRLLQAWEGTDPPAPEGMASPPSLILYYRTWGTNVNMQIIPTTLL